MQEILEKYIPKTKWLIHKLDFYKKWVTINVGWESHKMKAVNRDTTI